MMLLSRVLATMRKHRMLDGGERVLVALSGGADSIALLHLMHALAKRGDILLAGTAHFNHLLRSGSDEDERFCRGVAERIGVPFDTASGDVRAAARNERRSIEDAARTLRYAFLEQAADRLEADAIAVGHSLDDQAETFLLRLTRGAGPAGLAGIRPKAGRVIRPLIEISRAELRQYVFEHGFSFREDESNADRAIPRNRIRHELMPVLREYCPRIEHVLAREAEIARQDEERLHEEAIELARSIVLEGRGCIELDAERLESTHPALAARVVREALMRAAPGRFFGTGHIEAVLALGRDAAIGRSVSVPGQSVARVGRKIVLGRPAEPPFSNSFRFPLSIPGEVALTGWRVTAEPATEVLSSFDVSAPGAAATLATVAARALRLPLAVRNRRPGDRFKPLGMSGRSRKLQDFLVDRKVARTERDHLPLVVDGEDRIVWVVGHSVGEEFRVTEPTQGVILLKARRLGGAG